MTSSIASYSSTVNSNCGDKKSNDNTVDNNNGNGSGNGKSPPKDTVFERKKGVYMHYPSGFGLDNPYTMGDIQISRLSYVPDDTNGDDDYNGTQDKDGKDGNEGMTGKDGMAGKKGMAGK